MWPISALWAYLVFGWHSCCVFLDGLHPICHTYLSSPYLLGNAIKFTDIGSVTLNVNAITNKPDTITLLFEVIDTGIGIAQDKQKVIFDAFSQADTSTTREFGGTGLGLTISSQLVDLMGGEIGVESNEGKGSRFYFTAVFKKETIEAEDIAGTEKA